MCMYQDSLMGEELGNLKVLSSSVTFEIMLFFIYLQRWIIKQFVGAEIFLHKASFWDWVETASSAFLFHMPLVILASPRHCSKEIEILLLIS